MKAEELMVGDWIQIVPDAPIMPNECHRVDWIRTGEMGLDNRRIVTYPYIQPIPLTPEILEKSFPFPEVTWWHIDDKPGYWAIGIDIPDENDHTRWKHDYRGLHKYVHEVQHALKLCQIDKEITV